MTLEELLALRRRRQRPRQMVVLALCELPQPVQSPVIAIDGRLDSLDLRPLIDLEIEVAHDGRALRRVSALLDAVTTHRPRCLVAWNVRTGQRISVILHGMVYVHDVTWWP